MAHISCSDFLLLFLLFSLWVLLVQASSFSSYFCSVNIFINIRNHLQQISFQWCQYVWFIILLAHLTLVLGPSLYATPHYDWSFPLFSSMISAVILISYLVSLLILDLTAVISHSSPSIKESLELAYPQARKCGLFTRVQEIFPGPHQAYSLHQYDA